MKPEDPERYIRDLERRVGQTPDAAPFPASPPPLGTGPSSQVGDPGGAPRGFQLSRRAKTLTLAGVVALVLLGGSLFFGGLHIGNPFGPTTVHGNLIMENSGAKDTIVCNDGDLKLDGDNNTYTVTGHCRRLAVYGSGNRVTVDSADTIGIFGDDNTTIYRSGSPKISTAGSNNRVDQG
jgi:Protein of unknown function (DUF3060)